ncbi:glycosyltransferase family 2 protein [Candidatus Woesebacteria bacterium]|nr:glycosyltransferase family 2 protein [Candidatus Woesebacteria bacterium]
MTAYNAAEFVLEAVESIQNQTYSNWELIIVNDGSTDSTGKILVKLAKNDKRIVLINRRNNRGASVASNIGLSKACGQLIARMDSDDIAMPDRLMEQVKFLLDNTDVIVVGGQCELIDREGNTIGMKNFPTKHEGIYDALYQYNPIQHPSLMINTKLLGKHKITYHTDVLLAHDLEIVFKLAQYGRLANLDSTVLKYRIHNDSLSLKQPKETFKHTLVVREMARHKYGYVPSKRGVVTHIMQKMLMRVLPSFVVYPLFRIIRMRQVVEFKMRLAYAATAIVGIISR